MVLSTRNVTDYLVSRGIIGHDAIVDGGLVVTDTTRRNRNFRVAPAAAPGFFVKQVSAWDPMSIGTLEREARFYWLAWNRPALNRLSRWLPAFHSYESSRHALVIELIDGGEDLGAHHRRLGRFPEAVAAEVGRALADLHETGRAALDSDDAAPFPDHVPWILTVADAPAASMPPSGSLGELLRLLRSYPELTDGIEQARASWTADTLVHGDLKWENLIVGAERDGESVPLRVIDWELVHRGDAAWDVGAMIQAYLNFWVFTMPVEPDSRPADLVKNAPLRLESMWPALRSFWRAYREAGSMPDPEAFLARSMSYAACRMLQTAYESVQQAPRLTPHAVLLLQLSANTLKDPHAATRRLAGL